MAEASNVKLVKCFIAVLWREDAMLNKAIDFLTQQWGEVDFQGKDHLFDLSNYYHSEMGSPLNRRIISFTQLVDPGFLMKAKLKTNEFEEMLQKGSSRSVNLDLGYLDHNKVVLASLKGAGQKIYLAQGVYADLIARFSKGKYQPFEWAFLDFKEGRYDGELLEIRKLYLNQIKIR